MISNEVVEAAHWALPAGAGEYVDLSDMRAVLEAAHFTCLRSAGSEPTTMGSRTVISDEAVEAVAAAISAHNGERFDLMARAALEAAAPFLK